MGVRVGADHTDAGVGTWSTAPAMEGLQREGLDHAAILAVELGTGHDLDKPLDAVLHDLLGECAPQLASADTRGLGLNRQQGDMFGLQY